MAVDSAVALVTKDVVASFLKITGDEDAILEPLVNECSRFIRDYCGRDFVSAAYTEYYNGNGDASLILRQRPVVTFVALYNGDANRTFDSSTLVSSSDYFVDLTGGIVHLYNNGGVFIPGIANVKVQYVAGFSTIPYDIQHAAKLLIAQRYYKRSKARFDVQSQSVGDITTTFLDAEMPKEVQGILDLYRHGNYAPDFNYA